TPAPPPTASTPANTGPNATPIPAANAPATAILTQLGKTEAPGMKPDGSAFAGQFNEGQTLEQQVMINAGKCYTIVAAGMGMSQLDIQLVAQAAPNLPAVTIAQSNTQGPTAT